MTGSTLGVLDWGVGGLGFVKVLRARHPDARVVYWSDAGETPYGKLAAPALAARVREIAARLARRGVDRLVVACNAASTVLPRLGAPGLCGVVSTAAGPVQITGVIAHATRLALRARPRAIGVIGGRRTIRSGVYRRALAGREVRQRIAQPLSARVEAGDLASAALEGELRAILSPLRGIEALLLACTHYPAIAPRIAAHLPGTRLLDPADELARWVGARWLDDARKGRDVFLTTGSPAAMAKAARAAFGVELAATRVRR
ncbi:MAG TPA: aspartate/glutamate racemase family protein [Polyangia bacterium]|jgi:glutamate racemase|nr:aspartate/glutamate racemase family protein [Polyangia bacterium]